MSHTDPLWHLSHGPIIDRPGLYANWGPSPYTVEFLRPTRAFLAQKLANESLAQYIQRRMKMPDWPQWEEELAHHGLDINHVCSLHQPLVTPPYKEKRSRTGILQRIKNFFKVIDENCP